MAIRRILRKKEIALLDSIMGGMLFSAFFTPSYKGINYFADKREKYYTKKKLKEWSQEGLVLLGGQKIKLSKKGEKLLRTNMVHDLQITNHEKDWDGVWHLISYDIPDHKKSHRDYFRRKLEELGFVMIQKSMFVYPFNCKEEIALLALELDISPFVIHLTTSQLPNEEKYLKYFKLDSNFVSSKQ